MRTTEILSITLPAPMLKEARDLARQENRTMSELMREALRQYQRQRRMELLTSAAQATVLATNIRTEEDVVDAIHQFRREQRRSKPARAQKSSRKSA
ncbi:MAG TPA: ribbon-helix-helix protein, CopG family [Acidobacteriaceae bacterium]|nr:ribbon-helix-helix protein, CopG family [Acidobacteriaceae bacterium]